ncbi:hypothetical protein AAG570_000716 [Ranatra chinensis]|uniref:EF-hand domain-containing protein n=1 Tax=Ranatra chinensis TaxID=642074 RepID=A0ABD0ZER7_9HEMI
MGSKCRNVFVKNTKQETSEIGVCNCMSCGRLRDTSNVPVEYIPRFYDFNNDGHLDMEEFKALVTALLQGKTVCKKTMDEEVKAAYRLPRSQYGPDDDRTFLPTGVIGIDEEQHETVSIPRYHTPIEETLALTPTDGVTVVIPQFTSGLEVSPMGGFFTLSTLAVFFCEKDAAILPRTSEDGDYTKSVLNNELRIRDDRLRQLYVFLKARKKPPIGEA